MTESLPAILDSVQLEQFPAVAPEEIGYLSQARELFDAGFPAHALLDIWSAAIHNLRRRIEAYSVDIFLSSIKDEGGRKKFNPEGDTISERWFGVDDLILINGATRLGVLNKKAGKALEIINWMRNHASPAHASNDNVTAPDVIALALLLEGNLFHSEMPDTGHSPSGLFDPVKKLMLSEDRIEMLRDQIRSFRHADVRITFGFLVDLICKGEEPAFTNAKALFPEAWANSSEELKKSAGERYYSYNLNPDADDSADNGAKKRLLEVLVACDGIKYMPEPARAILYRHAVKPLGIAKNSQYGWIDEEKAARSLLQFGPYIPSIAFERVYQEILAVYCGNYWGRSNAHSILLPFIDALNSTQLMRLARLFKESERVQDELSQSKPSKHAVDLLNDIKGRLSIQANIDEVDKIIEFVVDL